MNALVQRAQRRAKSLVKKWKAESSARRFMAFCRQKWPWDPKAKYESVVLIGHFAHKLVTYCNAHLANDLACRTGSRIEAFKITGRMDPILRDVYASFGAPIGLDATFAESERPHLEKQADEIFSSLRTKWDLLELRYDGLKIGEAVYDSYLRYLREPTVNLEDPRLREIIFRALLVYVATTNYLKVRKIKAYIADDYSYHEAGIITRIMLRENVPVYISCFGPHYFLYRLYGEPETGNHDYPVRWPYHHFRTIFQNLSPQEQARCRDKGRQHLENKLAGQLDRFTLVNISAYGKSEGKIFPNSIRPRILVLLHDFFDNPHAFRWMLFPDFYDWACFLFERASETPFDWYMKPHPSSWDADRETLNEDNLKTINMLRERFPKIHFLPPTASNRQIVEEGISAMFTMYGTGGHEFARMGIPVVNAGDNPHICYDFNYHPRSLDEYADFIARADRLPLTADHDDIAEYVYMNYFYLHDRYSSPANPLPVSIFSDPNYEAHYAAPDGYDRLITAPDPRREAEIKEYYGKFFCDLPFEGRHVGTKHWPHHLDPMPNTNT